MADSKKLTILCLNKTYFVNELRARGHTVYTASVSENFNIHSDEMTSDRRFDLAFSDNTPIDALLARLPHPVHLDAVVYFDDSKATFYFSGLEKLRFPSLFYSVDAHIHEKWHPRFCGMFDRVLVAQKDFVPQFKESNSDCHWLPLWAAHVFEPVEPKTIDVCFRGSLDRKQRPERVKFLERLAALVPIDSQYKMYPEAFVRSKIIINELIGGDVNFRVFEAMACGGMLVTPSSGNGLFDLFEDGTHLVTYEAGNAEDAAEKIRYYLAHEEDRARIAAAGRRVVLNHHTAELRASEFESYLQTVVKTERPNGGYCAAFHDTIKSKVTFESAKTQSHTLLYDSAYNLLEARNQIATPTADFVMTCVSCAFGLSRLNNHQLAFDLLSQLLARYPQEDILAFGLLELLMRTGNENDAKTFATSRSADPQRYMNTAREMLSPLFEG